MYNKYTDTLYHLFGILMTDVNVKFIYVNGSILEF